MFTCGSIQLILTITLFRASSGVLLVTTWTSCCGWSEPTRPLAAWLTTYQSLCYSTQSLIGKAVMGEHFRCRRGSPAPSVFFLTDFLPPIMQLHVFSMLGYSSTMVWWHIHTHNSLDVWCAVSVHVALSLVKAETVDSTFYDCWTPGKVAKLANLPFPCKKIVAC